MPKTCALPEKYTQTQTEEYYDGLPFWEVETKYASFSDVPVGEKGNNCLGCEPGSGPDPFIVVYNDGKTMGFIYPYVTVVERNETKSEMVCFETTGSYLLPTNGDYKTKAQKKSVTVQINGDTSQKDVLDIKQVSQEYTIDYMTYEEMRELEKHMCCFNFGSFGNCALPNYSDPITLDGYFFRC